MVQIHEPVLAKLSNTVFRSPLFPSIFLLPLPTWLLGLEVCERIKGVYFVYFTVLHPGGEESAPVSVMSMHTFESELQLGEGRGHILTAIILMVYHQTLF